MEKWRGLVLKSIMVVCGVLSLLFANQTVGAVEIDSDFVVNVGSMLELGLSNCDLSVSSVLELNFDSPDVAGQFKSACQDVFVNTNNPGYTLTVKASGKNVNYLSNTNTNAMLYLNPTTQNPIPVILAKSSGTVASPTVIPLDTWGYGVENIGGFNTSYTPNLATDRYAQMTTSDIQIYKTTTFPLPRKDFKFYYGANLTPLTQAGSYATTITYTAVGEVVPCAWNDQINYDNPNCKNWNRMYQREMEEIEKIVADIIKYGDAYIGTALSSANPVQISGLNYGNNWYRLSASQLLAVCPSCDTTNSDYIVKYTTSTAGAVVSIPGRIIDGSLVHSFNYFGELDEIVYEGLLSAVNSESTRTSTNFGEFVLADCSGTGATCGAGNGVAYTDDGGLILGEDYGILTIDQSKPVGERFSVGVTIKGPLPQAVASNGLTVVAISPVSNNYVGWIGFSGNCMSIHAYKLSPVSVGTCQNTNSTTPGFINIDMTTIGLGDLNNAFMNIYLTAERGGEANVYVNGELIRTFPASNAVSGYGTMSIGDLRAGRGLKYNGALYDFAFYSEILTEAQILQNYNYSKTQLGF